MKILQAKSLISSGAAIVAFFVIICSISKNCVMASSTPDNFLFSFGKDIRKSFGLGRRNDRHEVKDDTKHSKKVTEVKVTSVDDYDEAEHEFFSRVENVEKVALNIASDLVRDEVVNLFGEQTMHRHERIPPPASRKTRNGNRKGHDNKAIKQVKLDDFVGKRGGMTSKNGNKKKMLSEVNQEEEQRERNAFTDMMETYASHCNDFGI